MFAGIPKGFGSSIPTPTGKPSQSGIESVAIWKPNNIHELNTPAKNK